MRWVARCIVVLLAVSVQVVLADRAPPLSWQMDELKPRSVTSVIEVKGIDASASRQRDTQEFKPGTPLLFAEARSAMVDVLARADRVLVDGFWIARLAIQAPGATDLNLHFARVVLPPRAMLHIYDAEMAVFQGPLIPPRRQPKAAQALWTPVIPGESGLIEISWPASSDLPVVELAEIWVGYRDLFGTRGGPFLNAKAGTCNNDVVCIEGDPWRDEIRSVARYSVNGGLCTGTLVNDSDSSLTPYFLTAYHCGVSEATVAGMVFYWNYESPVCGQLGGGSLTQNQTGAIFRARRQDVDMALVELA
ncbi:MAG: hypothetical protein V2J20_02860, partial [Wenzhouxiangella sp.]|nr:hypothetical protein [Wenzhouxiangella sp.]